MINKEETNAEGIITNAERFLKIYRGGCADARYLECLNAYFTSRDVSDYLFKHREDSEECGPEAANRNRRLFGNRMIIISAARNGITGKLEKALKGTIENLKIVAASEKLSGKTESVNI